VKKISAFFTLLIIILLSGCAFPMRFTEVYGSGQLATESRRISGVESVDLSGVGTLIIEQGDAESLEITADENLLNYIKSDVSGKKLQLGVNDFVDIQPAKDVVYHLTVKNISVIETSGLGNVEINSLETENLGLKISGSGSITISNLKAKTLELEISGLGNVDLSGSVDSQDIKISGAGNYQAQDLFSRQTDLEISGSGGATIWVADKLNLQLSGIGNLNYYGNPILTTEVSGMGKVQSMGNK
jgi:hypothetical protein